MDEPMDASNFSSMSARVKTLVWFCLLIWSEKSLAQSQGRFSIQLAAGAAFPVGKFGTAGVTSYPNAQANGSASVGPIANLKLAYQLNSWFGLAVSGGWQQNSYNKSAFLDSLKTRYPGYDHYQAHAGSWVVWNGMLGAFVLVPLKPSKLYLRPELNAGIAKTSVPGFSYTAYNQNITLSGPTPESGTSGKIPLASTFCYDVGAYLQWLGSSRLIYSGGIAFFHAAPSWKYDYSPSPGPGIPEITKFPISVLQVTLSAGYRF